MPEVSNQTISQGLANQLSSLSQASADFKADPKASKAALEATAAKTLAEIDAEIGSLNVSSSQFVQTIKDLIGSKDWAKLPPPKQMNHRSGQLMAVNDAIRDVQKTIITDISSIMAILLEIQRKAALAKGQERIQERNAMVDSAKAEFTKRGEAAKQQLIGDVVQAGIQVVTGVLGAASSAKSIAGLKGANAKTVQAWKKTEDLKPLQATVFKAKTDAANLSVKVPGAKQIKADADMKQAAGQALTKDEKTAAREAERILTRSNAEERKLNIGDEKLKHKRAKIDKLNEEAHQETQLIRAEQDLRQAVFGAVSKLGDLTAATMKFQSSMTQIEADKEALAKSLAQSGEQAALDAYQQLRDSLKSALQMIQAIEQAMASSMSSMARSI